MSLTLLSTNPKLNSYLRSIDGDDTVTPLEFQHLRDDADEHIAQLLKALGGVCPELDETLAHLQASMDVVAEGLQKTAIAARKCKKLSPEGREGLKEAIEHQLGYVIAGYQSSIQRL